MENRKTFVVAAFAVVGFNSNIEEKERHKSKEEWL